MRCRFATCSLASLVILGCGGGAPKPSQPTALAVGKGASEALRRGPSETIAKAWPLEHASAVGYVDLDGLMKTKLVGDLAQGVMMLAGSQLAPGLRKCVDQALTNVRELAVGKDDKNGVALLRVEPSSAKALGACFAASSEAAPTRVEGATDAWTQGKDVVALVGSTGLFVMGAPAVVDRALAGRGSSRGDLAAVALAPDEYLAWSMNLEEEGIVTKGTMLTSEQRFRIAGDVTLPKEELAKMIEQRFAVREDVVGQLASSGLKTEEAQALARMVQAWQLTRDGKRLTFTFELKEAPADQARDLGVMATLGVYGVRKYISSAKQAEAKNTVSFIAKDMMASWEMEDGKPRSRRKLVSFPPVPKAVPKGTKYQSSREDWKPWEPLRFEMTSPQYYQYEVKAAKDGESADIIARGDLNGDGKTSEFKITVKVKRPDDRLVVSPSIQETNPEE